MRNYIFILAILCSTTVFAQNPRLDGTWIPSTKTKSSNQKPRKKATDIVLDTTEEGEGRYYQTTGSISFVVEGQSYVRKFQKVEIGGFSETELTNQDNEDRYYPVALISKPFNSDETTMTVLIRDRDSGILFDDFIGLKTKRLK